MTLAGNVFCQHNVSSPESSLLADAGDNFYFAIG